MNQYSNNTQFPFMLCEKIKCKQCFLKMNRFFTKYLDGKYYQLHLVIKTKLQLPKKYFPWQQNDLLIAFPYEMESFHFSVIKILIDCTRSIFLLLSRVLFEILK